MTFDFIPQERLILLPFADADHKCEFLAPEKFANYNEVYQAINSDEFKRSGHVCLGIKAGPAFKQQLLDDVFIIYLIRNGKTKEDAFRILNDINHPEIAETPASSAAPA